MVLRHQQRGLRDFGERLTGFASQRATALSGAFQGHPTREAASLIRPVLYVNLPGIVRAFDRRARARQGDYAHFVVAPELDEARSGLAALLGAILPITPNALTWIVEDHWRLLGLAQARIRPGAQAWDLTYLAALTSSEATQSIQAATEGHGAPANGAASQGSAPSSRADDILFGLLQYALNAAIGRGAQRFFARVASESPELAIFNKLGFQRYAIETTYALGSAAEGLAALDDYEARPRQTPDRLDRPQQPQQPQQGRLNELSAAPLATTYDTLRPTRLDDCRERTPDAYQVEDALHQHSLALAATSALATPGERAPRATMADVLRKTWQEGAPFGQSATGTPTWFAMGSGERDANEPEAAEQPPAPATVSDRAGGADLSGVIRPDMPLRPWRRRDAWGLLRLYDACTPRRVQVAESLTSEEFLFTRAAGGRAWYMPLLEPPTAAFVYDRGDRLGGWLRIRHGRGAEPHLLALLAHPDDDGVAIALVRFALRIFAREAPRPIICMARGYESEVANALRLAGFTPQDERALLVRHLTARVVWSREVPAFDSRMVYGVKGFGTAPTRLSGLSKGGKERLCLTSSTTISTPCSPCYPCASGKPLRFFRTRATSSKSSSTLGASPKVDSPRAKSF